MKKFYYSDGKEQFGPFTLEELKEKGIDADTLVWYQGLESWVPAGKAPYLKEVFGFTPPPIIKVSEEKLEEEKAKAQKAETETESTGSFSQSEISAHRMPRVWLVESILVTLFCCLPFGIVGIVFSAQVEGKYNAGDIEGAYEMSRKAGQWTKIGFFTGLAVLLAYFFSIAVGVVAGL
nr:CD225/dispanin family protein [Saprospiraceae bacterium]